ncbi:MAG: SpoIIIAH-like family protein [Bacilli bacterium]|nr:SpoIIIAH-like family protein [Bacilli bacterium]
MLNKQNIWFMTLFSLILVLGVYYVTMPNDTLKKIAVETKKVQDEKTDVEEVMEESSLTALRVSKEEQRKEKMESLQTSLTDDDLSTNEKNNTFELLKYLNEIQGKENGFEKKLKKEFGLDCYTKIDQMNISVICVSNEHDTVLANNIMKLIQKEYQEPMSITVKFQKK